MAGRFDGVFYELFALACNCQLLCWALFNVIVCMSVIPGYFLSLVLMLFAFECSCWVCWAFFLIETFACNYKGIWSAYFIIRRSSGPACRSFLRSSFLPMFLISKNPNFSKPPTPKGENYLPLHPLLGRGLACAILSRPPTSPTFSDVSFRIDCWWHSDDFLNTQSSKIWSQNEPKCLPKSIPKLSEN